MDDAAEIKTRLAHVLHCLEGIDQNLSEVERGITPASTMEIARIRDIALAGMARLDAIVNELL